MAKKAKPYIRRGEVVKRHEGIVLTDELRDAITEVFDAAQQDWDRGEGWPPDDPKIVEAFRRVYRLTNYAKKRPEPDF
jgi:hypothetical protein